MYTIAKTLEFSAAHRLAHLPPGHPCHAMHGHNYVVTLVLECAQLNDQHMVRDYRALSIAKDWLDEHYDHRCLNDVMDVPPTAENMARVIFRTIHTELPELVAVRVSETPKTWAEYRPGTL